MPQDTDRDHDTVRLEPDGTLGARRPAAPDDGDGPAEPQPAVETTAAIPPVETTAAIPPVGTTAAVPPAAGRPAVPPAGPDGPGSTGGGGRAWWRRPVVYGPAAAVLVLAAAYGADLAVSSGEVPRGTVVSGVDVGGLSPAAAQTRLNDRLADRIGADHPLTAADVQAVLHPPSAGIALDAARTVDAVDDQPLNPWTRLRSFFGDTDRRAVLAIDRTALDAQVEQVAATVDRAPVDATIALDGTTPRVVDPADGRTLDRAGARAAITEAIASGAAPSAPIELPVEVARVRVDAAAAQRALEQTVTPALAAPVTVARSDGGAAAELSAASIAGALTFSPADDGTLAVALDPPRLREALGEGFEGFGTPAKDATFQVSGGSISVVPSVDGTGVDPAKLAADLLPVLSRPAPREVTAQLGPVPAAFTTEQAQALGIKEEVSSFTTNFTNAASGTNIRVVAEKVDGALVKPGETFSLNTFTGPRGTAQGYVPAAVISGGELSQAVGGGISQFATTMFNAVFFAGLDDVYHKPHSFYISRYPAGREATVYEGVIDLQWRNDTDTGIYVQTEWVPGALTVTFWGTKHYDVESVSSERRNLREPAVQEKVDDGNCTPQSGSTGFDITVTRVFKDLSSGAELRREDFNTRYAAEAVIHCVPPAAPAAPSAPADGTQPTG
ncbi:VanW family protein [Modestobacter sp. NPDC049651]|uniref:VanW family protein n=1 Tax=unclassified Modestobacter TaxID=2643866 RepID=UPI0033EB5589